MVLIAVVCTVIGTVTTLALRSHLYGQLDGQVHEVATRAVGGPDDGGPRPQHLDDRDPLEFVVVGPQGIGTIGATVGDGRVTDGIVSTSKEENGFTTPEAEPLTGAQNAASHQLATGDPVTAIGGFNGTDPSPTLAQFQQYVAEGRIHYFVAGGGMGGGTGGGTGEDDDSGDSSTSSQIASWAEEDSEEVTADPATFYDLTRKADG
ncbi:hypothetical protein [Streptomyces sp. NEAU-W12]|uniref:hypothetical protein n=1 Tax=Streptomyces sp. NEAU-W12 TaxID=2994668 RepID=UPI003A4C700A